MQKCATIVQNGLVTAYSRRSLYREDAVTLESIHAVSETVTAMQGGQITAGTLRWGEMMPQGEWAGDRVDRL